MSQMLNLSLGLAHIKKTNSVAIRKTLLALVNYTYRTRATISRSRFEAALVYKPRILSLKNEEFPFLVHKLSVI